MNNDINYEKGDNKYFFRMFRFVKPYALPYFFGKFMHSSQGFALPFIISVFSASVMQAITNRSTAGVYSAILLLFGMMIGYIIPIMIGIYVYNMAEQRAIRDLKKHLFRSFINNNLESANTGHSGEGIAAINTDADTACRVYAWPLTAFLISLINIVFSSIVVFVIDVRMGLAAVFIGLIGFALQNRYTKPLAEINRRRLNVIADIVKSVSNIFSGAIAIRAYGMQDNIEKQFEPDIEMQRTLTIKEGLIEAWQSVFTTKIEWLALVASFGLGGFLVATDRLEFHLLMMLPLMCITITQGFNGIGSAYANLQGPIAGAKRVFKILDESGTNIKIGGVQRDANGYTISIKDVNFKYMGAECNALSDINLQIEENKMVAFVGESGSGKSTLLRAIVGLYERTDLGITLGDLSFNESSTKNWRRNFAYVDQSCKLFDMTIKENIAMGRGGKATDSEVTDAAKRAAAHSFIEELSDGYDTPSGEKGGTLSGGQKQRIAIARALVKKAPVLVFDEATSALDTQSEQYIMDTIESLRGDHTILITTHNLENIVTADLIVVLDAGRVVAVGTHSELMENGGVYYRLYTKE